MRAFLLLSSLLLAACGQAGDLYLPTEPAPPAAQPPAPPAPAAATPPEAKKDKK